MTRRALITGHLLAASFLLGGVALFTPRPGLAESAAVPADLQAELLAKLAAYDRNFTSRAGSVALVLIVVKPGNARSNLSAAVMKSELAKIERIGGLPHREVVMPFESPAALAARVRSERAAIVYVTPGLEEHTPELRKAFTGVDVLSVSAVPSTVAEGIVLGFELVSGKPKILHNLTQARLQKVSFKADVLKLMKVYR
jgi:hypothetical protein